MILEKTDNINLDIKENFPMKDYTTIKIGGPAKYLIYPNSIKDLINLLNKLHNENEKFIVLGAGSNTVISDEGIKQFIISTRKLKKFKINESDLTVEAECGAMMSSLMNNSIKLGLTGFEFWAGIPGTVGGGVYMNAGANGGETKDCVKEIYIWHEGNEIKLDREDINFEYRKSNLPSGSIVTRAVFQLQKGNKEEIQKNVKKYLEYRNSTQPVKWANTGSIFKNPKEIPAGKLLEELGFKGKTVGGAKFSDLHANFIVNENNATAIDVKNLINSAKKQAFEQRNIKLETEVEFIEEENSL